MLLAEASGIGSFVGDIQIPTRCVPFVIVKFPSPLNEIYPRLTILGDLETSTARSEISIPFDVVAILVLQDSNGHLHEFSLFRVCACGLRRHVDEHASVLFIANSMVLRGPANTYLVASSSRSHRSPLTTVSL